MSKALALLVPPGTWTPATVKAFNELIPGKFALTFDGDGSQFMPSGDPCSLCGCRQTPAGMPRAFVRVRRKTTPGTSLQVAQLCPNCIARAVLQVERLSLWTEVSPAVRAAIKRMLTKRRRVAVHR